MNLEPRMLKVCKNVLKQNDVVARALRVRFRAQGTLAVSLVSSPGAGKATFLEKTLTLLKPHFRVAGLVSDSGHGKRCAAAGAQRGAREADHYRNALPP
jgi:hydrogenase nickel incorporation protein HypB